jgi:hypothetical protein
MQHGSKSRIRAVDAVVKPSLDRYVQQRDGHTVFAACFLFAPACSCWVFLLSKKVAILAFVERPSTPLECHFHGEFRVQACDAFKSPRAPRLMIRVRESRGPCFSNCTGVNGFWMKSLSESR